MKTQRIIQQLIACLVILWPMNTLASQLSLTSYFPTPFSYVKALKADSVQAGDTVVKSIRYTPISFASISALCLNSVNLGATYTDQATGKMYVCNASGVPELAASSIWKLSNNVLYPPDGYPTASIPPAVGADIRTVTKVPRLSVSDWDMGDSSNSEYSKNAVLQVYTSAVASMPATIFATGTSGYNVAGFTAQDYEFLPWGGDYSIPKLVVDIPRSNFLFGLWGDDHTTDPHQGFFNFAQGNDYSFIGNFNTIFGSDNVSSSGNSNSFFGSDHIVFGGSHNGVQGTTPRVGTSLTVNGDYNNLFGSQTTAISTIAGNKNTFIGATIGNITGSNNIVIGSPAAGSTAFNASDTVTIYQTKVGIGGPPDLAGTTALKVAGTTSATNFIKSNGTVAVTATFPSMTCYAMVNADGTNIKSDASMSISKIGVGTYRISMTGAPTQSPVPGAYVANVTPTTGATPAISTATVSGHDITVRMFTPAGILTDYSFNVFISLVSG